jgi:hypothetical protein
MAQRFQMLSDKQERFAIEYAKCGNGTQAAKRAGYSEHTARSQASSLLAKSDIRKRVQEAKEELAAELRNEMRQEAVAAFQVLRNIMNNDEARDSDRIKCAVDLLDRAGYLPEKKIEVSANKTDLDKMDSILASLGMLHE